MECLHIDLLQECGHLSGISKVYESSEMNSEVRKYMDSKEFCFNVLGKIDFTFQDILGIVDKGKTILDFAREGRWEKVYPLVSGSTENDLLEVILISSSFPQAYDSVIKECKNKWFSKKSKYCFVALELSKKGLKSRINGKMCEKDFDQCLNEIEDCKTLQLFKTYVYGYSNDLDKKILKKLHTLVDVRTEDGRMKYKIFSSGKSIVYSDEVVEPFMKKVFASSSMKEYHEAMTEMFASHIEKSNLSYTLQTKINDKYNRLLELL